MLELEFISSTLASVQSEADQKAKFETAATRMLTLVLRNSPHTIPSRYIPLLVNESVLRLVHGYSNGLSTHGMTPEEAARTSVLAEFGYCQGLFDRVINGAIS